MSKPLGQTGEAVGRGGERKVRRAALFLSIMTVGYAVYAADRTVLTSLLVKISSSLGLSNL